MPPIRPCVSSGWLLSLLSCSLIISGCQFDADTTTTSGTSEQEAHSVTARGATSDNTRSTDSSLSHGLIQPLEGSVVYFEKPGTWADADVHVFDASPDGVYNDTQWPGLRMRPFGDGWYSVYLPSVASADLVFSDNGANQSPDLSVNGISCFTDTWVNDCTVLTGEVPTQASMHWVDERTLVWQGLENFSQVRLYHSPDADLTATGSGVFGSGGFLDLTSGQSDSVPEAFAFLNGPVFDLDSTLSTAHLGDVLTNQLVAVAYDTDGLVQAATRVQIPGALDALYASGADSAVDVNLGLNFNGSDVQFNLWAPTALSVNLQQYDANQQPTGSVPMSFDAATGVWSTKAFRDDVDRQYFRYQVSVVHPETQAIETHEVTDPYSLSLSADSRYSQVVDLRDQDLKPSDWDTYTRPVVADPTDLMIYEAHVRDFSARDTSTPEQDRGKYSAFSHSHTAPMQHLQSLADAGLNMIHLLPVNDLGSIHADAAKRIDITNTVGELCAEQPGSAVCGEYSDDTSLLSVFESFDPSTDRAQDLVNDIRFLDGFNWGYDPYHFFAPEGSYATEPDGVTRIRELRELIANMHRMGLTVALDVVFNHTFEAGLDNKSVLDKVVPGYYHRLNEATGAIEDTTCCPNTATEWPMMEKLMADSLAIWAEHYRFDAFRFDLMGHIPRAAILRARDRVQAIHPTNYFYGEGWNFGEVMNDRRFEQGSQLNMAGTDVGTFSDRMREAVRSGGLYVDRDDTLNQSDVTRIGLVGNVGTYSLPTASDFDQLTYDYIWNGQPAGYSDGPADTVNYVSKHDNETLWDILQDNLPGSLSTEDRTRAHQVALSYPLLAQGIPFLHMGSELMRSKSLDRDSYDSGDWFNYVDFTGQTNNWNVGLPVREKNEPRYDRIRDLIQNSASNPAPQHIDATHEHFLEFMRIRASSKLFRLATATDVRDRVRFHNTGSDQQRGLIVMSVDDGTAFTELDPNHDAVVTLFNASADNRSINIGNAADKPFQLHAAHGTDSNAAAAGFDIDTGTFTVPARTTAVFVRLRGDQQGPGLSGEALAAPDTQYLRGTMNGWDNSDAMTWLGGETYEIAFTFNDGTYEFKLANSDWNLQTNDSNFVDGGGTVSVTAAGSDGNLSMTLNASGDYRIELDRSNPDAQLVTVDRID